MGHFQLSCQCLAQGLNPVTRWELIPGHWQILAELSHMLSHMALNCHFCELEDRTATVTPTGLTSNVQKGENTSAWFALWGKAGQWKQSSSQQRAPSCGNLSTGKPALPGYFWSTHTNWQYRHLVFLHLKAQCTSTVYQTCRATLPGPYLCLPLAHPPC